MNTKFTSTISIVLFILFSSSILFSQQSQLNRPQSSGNNNKNYRSHNSTISNPADDHYNNRSEITNKKTQRTKYKTDKHNITKSENYFHIDKSGKTLWDGKHWDSEEFPLKFYVKESSSKFYSSEYEDYVSYAFEVWQRADNRIKYIYTNNSRNADIQFIFVEDLGKKYEENYLGLTEYDVNRSNEIEQSKIQISLFKHKNELVSEGEIKATIIHELGHALGLGHSDNENDIMYPYISPNHSSKMTYDELSRGDKEAIEDVIDLGNDEKYVWK